MSEANERFALRLLDPTNALVAEGVAVGIILNDDGVTPVFACEDVSLVEGDAGTTNAQFHVTLSGGYADRWAMLNYSTADYTAKAGSDYVATDGTLIFAPCQTTASFSVVILGDRLSESN